MRRPTHKIGSVVKVNIDGEIMSCIILDNLIEDTHWVPRPKPSSQRPPINYII